MRRQSGISTMHSAQPARWGLAMLRSVSEQIYATFIFLGSGSLTAKTSMAEIVSATIAMIWAGK
jgi:hypothetical protein